jgi:hypothetical protein
MAAMRQKRSIGPSDKRTLVSSPHHLRNGIAYTICIDGTMALSSLPFHGGDHE